MHCQVVDRLYIFILVIQMFVRIVLSDLICKIHQLKLKKLTISENPGKHINDISGLVLMTAGQGFERTSFNGEPNQ